MKALCIRPLWVWAARDLLRHPLEALLLAAALSSLVALSGTALLLTRALSETAAGALESGPSLVVRRIETGGWMALPADEALGIALAIPGVVDARARIWGVASGPAGAVTVFGADELAVAAHSTENPMKAPGPGEAILGPGVGSWPQGSFLKLSGRSAMEFKVIGFLDPEVSLVAHDLVLLHPADARKLLGLPPGFASDLALYVFHDEEGKAMLSELSAAFPWPVRIVTRTETLGACLAGAARTGGIALFLTLPALLALGFIVSGTVRERIARRHEVGLLKALGWTASDVVRLRLVRALLLGCPAAVLGMAVAYGLVYLPGSQWPGYLLLGWKDNPPGLSLSPSGAVPVLLEIGAVVILPFLLATLYPALRGATADPQDLFEGHDG